jgi:hypothetical protein
MSAPISLERLALMTVDWCLCAAYRLTAAAHVQQVLLDEAALLALETEAIEEGIAAAQAVDCVVIGGEKQDAIDKGAELVRGIFAKFRKQRVE